ncbi:hypothetical protein [Streptomyces sp. NPDC006267]|uniref:hypothetical protein n=1 Tax=Streptomyces sp. NPDC006267 TaxID=3157173 RepID=UPI0033BD7041
MVRYFDDADVNRVFKQVATEQAYQLIRRPVRREAEQRVTERRAAELKSAGGRRAEPPPA